MKLRARWSPPETVPPVVGAARASLAIPRPKCRLRALLVALDDWVTLDENPPACRAERAQTVRGSGHCAKDPRFPSRRHVQRTDDHRRSI